MEDNMNKLFLAVTTSLFPVILASAPVHALTVLGPGAATISESGSACGAEPCTATNGVGFSTGAGADPPWTNGTETYSTSGVNYNVSTVTTNTPTTTNGSISVGGGGNSSSVSLTATTSPSLSSTAVFAAGSGAPGAGSLNQAQFTYYYEVVTPMVYMGPTDVDVTVTASGSAQVSGNASGRAQALLQIGGFAGGLAIDDSVSVNLNGQTSATGTGVTSTCGTGCLLGTFQEDSTSLEVAVNTVYEVVLNTLVNCGSSNSQSGTQNCSATVDPTIVAPNGLTVDFSSNLATPAATPVPAALPLFASGLGAMGLFGWRRKRKLAASTA
jgi:hypothetical protein